MLLKTPYTASKQTVEQAALTSLGDNFRYSINRPTGNFFYDPWVLKEEFKNTVWEELYNSLPEVKGEARVIRLAPATCYFSHADIDDRWHLNLSSTCAYLVDLDSEQMAKLEPDGQWYSFNAGPRHSAVNFGNRPRLQLVIRKLLTRANRDDLVKVKITSTINDPDDARFLFDNKVSTFLNFANKEHALDNFDYAATHVSFDIAPNFLDSLKLLLTDNFRIEL